MERYHYVESPFSIMFIIMKMCLILCVFHYRTHTSNGVQINHSKFPYYNFRWIHRMVVNSEIVWIKFIIMHIFIIIAAGANIEVFLYVCLYMQHIRFVTEHVSNYFDNSFFAKFSNCSMLIKISFNDFL